MKYPQLVSTRAVNAISDWLVSRLEQLGVEAPLIYSRLLLSLLHSSVQINDPIEFNNLETYLTSRKGNKRNPPCDTDTLKKLTAVQCLMETVSSEQEIAKIENLVDELCEKLNDIEKQINSDEEEQHFQAIENILNTLSTGNNCITNSTSVNNQNIANPSTSGAVSISISKSSSINSNCNISVKRTQSESIRNNNINNNKSDLEDPRKRYYSAFPALSKEMEDSFRISNRNTKALTWPVSKSSSLQIINNSNIINNKSELYNNTAGVKRKPKRRRNQAMSKGRTSYNIRKNSLSGNCSPTWDTDFEGSWEMGRDLIKEFIVKENNRNRSTSESAAYNTIDNSNNDFVNEKRMKPMDDNEMENNLYIDLTPSSNIKNYEQVTTISKIDDIPVASNIMDHEISSTTTLPEQQNNFNIVSNRNCSGNLIGIINDEGYSTHETLTSLSELDSSVNFTRRLYERDISNDEDSSTSMNLCSNIEQQQYDFAQFKAKFNSSVEALWKNIPNEEKTDNNQENVNLKKENLKNINESSSLATKKDNGLKMNLDNFWTNYYNHHYDPHKVNINDNSPYKDDIAIKKEYENEYLSTPNNSMKQSGGGGHDDNNTIKTRETTRLLMKVPSGAFLQDSIWSDSATNYDDDDSFYANVLKSSYKNDSKNYDGGSSNDDKNQQNSYLSKWSEGINGVSPLETSFIPIQSPLAKLTSSAQPQYGVNELNDLNRKDLRENMLKNSYFYNNTQQLQQQEQFTNNNNNTFYHNYSISLPSDNIYYNTTDLYHHNIDQSSQQQQHQQITLKNHSVKSGFVEYSLIKSQKKNILTNVICKSNINIESSTTSSMYGNSTNSGGIEEENLLTSERTHFRPIKQTYADGYTFDISNNYDEINYKRSPSGYLHFDGDKYLEYTRSEAMPTIEDDSSATTLSNITKNGKNRRHGVNRLNQLSINGKRKKEEFILKFRIKSSNEKCCQTDSSIIGNNSEYILKMTKGRTRYQINDKNFDIDNDYEEECSSDDIESMENINYYSNIDGNNIVNKSDIIKRRQLPSGNQVIDQWSMIEIGKKCLDNISSNLRNSNNNGTHTLWGLCPACNMIDTKSAIPANRLLKDELNIEADEIMSDLKYMQDLYIGGGGGNGSDWDDEDDDTDFDIGTIKDCDYYHQSTANNNHHKYSSDNFFIAQNKFDNNNMASAMITDDDEQLQKDMFYNVTKLITDFLKPENAKTLANVLVGDIEENQQCLNKFFGGDIGNGNSNKIENEVNNNQTNKYFGGLWNNEHNIWKENDFKPIDNILTRLNNNNNTNYTNNNLNIDSTKDFDGKINWEFSNLAEIWHKNIITPQEEKLLPLANQESIDKFINKTCFKNVEQYQISSGQIKHIDKMDNDDEEILNKLDQKISENISQLTNKEQIHQFREQLNYKRKNHYFDEDISKQKLNQIHQHSQSLDDSRTMDIINNKNLNTNILKNQNRFDRKRRHSAASQNIIITTTTATTINDIIKNNSNYKLGYKNNNNSDNIIVDGGGEINSNNENNTIKSSINTKNFFDNLIIGNNQNIEILSSKDLLNYGSKFNTKIANDDCIVDDNDDDNDKKDDISPTSATIITCKYWTTIDATPHKTATFILDNKNSIGTGSVGGVGQWNRNFVVDSMSNVCCKHDDDDGGIGNISINPSSILKHVALIARPLTR